MLLPRISTRSLGSSALTTEKKITDLITTQNKSVPEVALLFNKTTDDVTKICFDEIISIFSLGNRDKSLSLKDYALKYKIEMHFNKLDEAIRKECIHRYSLDVGDNQKLNLKESVQRFDIGKSSLYRMIAQNKGKFTK